MATIKFIASQARTIFQYKSHWIVALNCVNYNINCCVWRKYIYIYILIILTHKGMASIKKMLELLFASSQFIVPQALLLKNNLQHIGPNV